MKNKFEAFDFITKRIKHQTSIIKSALNEVEVKEFTTERILYDSDNNETSCKIVKYDALTTTKTIIDNIPKRITCLSGEINVIIPHFDEKIKLKPQDSQLIPSKTYHIIEATKPSEVIMIFKHLNNQNVLVEEITEKNSIYSKL